MLFSNANTRLKYILIGVVYFVIVCEKVDIHKP